MISDCIDSCLLMQPCFASVFSYYALYYPIKYRFKGEYLNFLYEELDKGYFQAFFEEFHSNPAFRRHVFFHKKWNSETRWGQLSSFRVNDNFDMVYASDRSRAMESATKMIAYCNGIIPVLGLVSFISGLIMMMLYGSVVKANDKMVCLAISFMLMPLSVLFWEGYYCARLADNHGGEVFASRLSWSPADKLMVTLEERVYALTEAPYSLTRGDLSEIGQERSVIMMDPANANFINKLEAYFRTKYQEPEQVVKHLFKKFHVSELRALMEEYRYSFNYCAPSVFERNINVQSFERKYSSIFRLMEPDLENPTVPDDDEAKATDDCLTDELLPAASSGYWQR